ncbi:MAG: hypothetical protein AAF845_07800 [Bacteroidota bacterium]
MPADLIMDSLEVLPIYPDDDAPVREGYKVALQEDEGFAFFPDTTYGSTEAAYAAASDWAVLRSVDEADTRNVIRIEIDPREEVRTDKKGRKKTVRVRRSTYGWQVRMRRQGEAYSQFFNDNHFGGSAGALKAAQYWRNLRDAELTRTDPKTAADRSRATRSQFGVPGLRVLVLDVGNGHHSPYLQASWPEETASGTVRRKRKTYSLAKHDPQEVTARLCRMLVRARGTDALPSTEDVPAGKRYPAHVQREAEAFEDALRTTPPAGPALTDAQRAAYVATFAELYDRAWRGVTERLPEAERKAARLSGEKA